MSRSIRWLCVVCCAFALTRAGADERVEGAEAKPSERKAEQAAKEQRREPRTVYVPPSRGTTRTRTGGGTRAVGNPPRLSVLAPDHIALTTQPAPTLAWYVSAPTRAPLVLTLVRDDAIDPVLEVTLTTEVEAGIAQASLARWDVVLEPGVVYEWSVSLVADETERDRDAVASGAIERVAMPPAIAGGDPSWRQLAQHGIWYDAVAALGDAIASGDANLRVERAALLEAVGLTAAADFDRTTR